ncbi:hypothetical protein BCR35DRAFT_302725 [Leucosporidium creatinivorum]|uniref:Uncharacterized protein n=1 Tax=Leucosporidium creatinivorum TaxID=106004 RepID=A0A1Y2FTP6_9BASI|nr:hypothetical protein BCR35DRAFT_302725 [Leucosporidium creatinivorum]
MRDYSRPPSPPALLDAAAQVPLPPSPKPFARFFLSTNRSRTPQEIPLPPSPMRPSSALSTSSNDEHSRYSSFDSPSAEPSSRWSPYSTPQAPKSNPFAALRRSLNISSASAVGSSSNSTRSSILVSSEVGIQFKEIVHPSPRLRLPLDTDSLDPLPHPQPPLSPSHFNFLKRTDPPPPPSPFSSAIDTSPSSGSPPLPRRVRKTFWPSRVSSGRGAEQGAAPNKLGEKLSHFVEDAKRKLGGSRRGRSKSVDTTRSARELDAKDDRLLKAALWTLFGDGDATSEKGDVSMGEVYTTESDDCEDGASSPNTISLRLLRRRPDSTSPASRAPHPTPAQPPRRRTPKLPRVSLGAPFKVDAPFLVFDEGEENDTSGEETPKASRMVRKVMSVEELVRERDGDETPTRHRTPRHFFSTPALRASSSSDPTLKTRLVLKEASVPSPATEEDRNGSITSSDSVASNLVSSVDQQQRDGAKEDERRNAHPTTRSFGDLTNTLPHSNGSSPSSHTKAHSISNSYTRSQVRCHSPLAQAHFPAEDDDPVPPLRFSQRRPAVHLVRLSFASEEGEGMEQQEEQWVDEIESEEGSDGQSQPRHSVESSTTFGHSKQVRFSDSQISSVSDQEETTGGVDHSSATRSSLPTARPPSYPPLALPRAARNSSEWLSYAEAEEQEHDEAGEDELGDPSLSPSTPTALARSFNLALQTPLPRSSSTDSPNSRDDSSSHTDDSPTSPPLPPVDRDDRRRSHPIPYTSLRSLPSLNSLEAGVVDPQASMEKDRLVDCESGGEQDGSAIAKEQTDALDLDEDQSTIDLLSASSNQLTPRAKPRSLPTVTSSTTPSSPTHPSAPNSTPTAAVRYKDATTHPLLRGTFLLSTKFAAAVEGWSAGGAGGSSAAEK